MGAEETTHQMGLARETFFSAQDLRDAMEARRNAQRAAEQVHQSEMAKARAAEIERLKTPVDVPEDKFDAFMRRVRQAAESGEKQIMILRFPSGLCTDSGRAINNALSNWEETLVGVPKQMHDIWEQRLKPSGFHLSAEVLDFPGGMPGDIGLFLRW
jgi:hypothetical protein